MKYEVKKLENKNMAITLDFTSEEWEALIHTIRTKVNIRQKALDKAKHLER